MGGANVSPWVASAKESRNLERAVFSWHWGRDIHTTVFNDFAGVQAIRAHLRQAVCPFDLWILKMKLRGETETNHLRFWKSFRMDWLSKLIGGEKGLIFLRCTVSDSLSVCFSVSASVCGAKRREWEWLRFPPRLIDMNSLNRKKCAALKQCKHKASSM